MTDASYLCSPYQGDADLHQMVDFLTLTRPKDRLTDYPSRVDLQELLSLPHIQQQTRLFRNAGGDLLAFAFVDAYHNLVFEAVDGESREAIAQEILDFGISVAQKAFPGENLDAACREEDEFKMGFYARQGFNRLAEKSIDLEFDLSAPILPAGLPDGYHVRPVEGESELEAYVKLHQSIFGSRQMTLEMRIAIMHALEYRPDLDLVLIKPDGGLAGLLVCQISEAANKQTDRRVGWTDPIGILPSERGRGLAKGLLLIGLGWLKENGMRYARMSTLSSNLAMLATALSVGFQQVGSKVWWTRSITAR